METFIDNPEKMNRTPRLEMYRERVRENARVIAALCHGHGARVAAVTKVFCAHPAIAWAMLEGGVDMLADSRLANLRRLREHGLPGPLLLLRLPTPSEATEVVRIADISLNSSVATVQKLSDAAQALNIKHQVILMVDLGDLREGVWPDKALATLQQIHRLPGIEVVGLGCNLACFGGVIPTPEIMLQLVSLRELCRQHTGLELPWLSGGNSSGLPLLATGKMPAAINHFRVGETILLGCNVIDRSPFPGTRQDAFIVASEVLEVAVKPSVPVGERGQDAFGNVPTFVDRGLRRRAICNLGRQDVAIDGLQPLDPGITVLGGSSDHLLLDVEDAQTSIEIGSEIRFLPGYGALLALSTSPYVQKIVKRG